MKHINPHSDAKGKCGHHNEGDRCYECGYGIKRTCLWKVAVVIVLGLLLGWALSGANLLMADIVRYIELVLLACTLGIVLDIRKMMMNCGYKGRR